MDLKIVLHLVPKWDGLPLKPPENNHKMDSNNFADKQHKAWQQHILHCLRMYAAVYHGTFCGSGDAGFVKTLSQQRFQLLVELYQKLEIVRKETSIPGSSAEQGSQAQLFGKDDLSNASMKMKINQAGKS